MCAHLAQMFFKPLFFLLTLVVALLPDTKNYFGFDIQIREQELLHLPDSFSGPLVANWLLSNADHLFLNEIRGPESFAIWNDKVYTSLGDGRIVQVLSDRLETVAILDPNNLGLEQCRKPHNAGRCGRPLGLKFDSRGILYTVDPYHGLYSVNVTSGQSDLIVDISKERGLGARFLDDLALLEKGNGHLVFYLSDASTEWDLYDVAYMVAEHDRSGRLLSFDTETRQVKIELDKLSFPNGLELIDDRSALLICSFNNRRILKYQLSGKDKGNVSTLIDNLPGEPDNIKRSRSAKPETYWIGLFTARNEQNPHITLDIMANFGYLKRFAFRMQRIIGFLIERLGALLHSDFLMATGFDIKTGHIMNLASCHYGMAIEIDLEGRIINSLHSPDAHTCALSEAFEVKQTDTERHFYLGSFGNPYLGKLVLPKTAFSFSTNSSDQSSKSQQFRNTTAAVHTETQSQDKRSKVLLKVTRDEL